jgi:N-acetyl-gamma-glutamylphosphate reductase
MILITGATGTNGIEIVRLLSAQASLAEHLSESRRKQHSFRTTEEL